MIVWADGSKLSPQDYYFVNILRLNGCKCERPLLGYRENVGPRCRLCNTEATEMYIWNAKDCTTGITTVHLTKQDAIDFVQYYHPELIHHSCETERGLLLVKLGSIVHMFNLTRHRMYV